MSIQFKITVVKGEKSPYEWYTNKIKEYAKEKYGLDLTIKINPKYENDTKELSDTH